jgi:D-amino-acid oxidase
MTIKRSIITHISEAAALHSSGIPASIVINCTGLSALKLGGVMDTSLFPGRGQTVLVRNDPGFMITISGTDDGDDEATYIMPRAAGGGTILGGCMQHNNWDSQPDPNLAQRIMQRSIDLCPALAPKTGKPSELSVIRHGVGLRPMRRGGIRVEKEKINGTWVVHNYGHAGELNFSARFTELLLFTRDNEYMLTCYRLWISSWVWDRVRGGELSEGNSEGEGEIMIIVCKYR